MNLRERPLKGWDEWAAGAVLRLIRGGGSSGLKRGFGGAWEADERGEGVLQRTPSSSSSDRSGGGDMAIAIRAISVQKLWGGSGKEGLSK